VLGRVYKFLVEGRITDSGSYRVERKEFLELRKQAYQSPPGLLPMMRLDIAGLRLVVIEEKDMDEMQTRMLDLEERLANRETDSDGL